MSVALLNNVAKLLSKSLASFCSVIKQTKTNKRFGNNLFDLYINGKHKSTGHT